MVLRSLRRCPWGSPGPWEPKAHLEALVQALGTLSKGSDALGLTVSWIMNTIHKFAGFCDGNIDLPSPLTMLGEHFSFMDSFVYLGVLLPV